MATFKIILNTRVKLKNNRHNLCVRVFDKNKFLDLNIEKLTKEQYDKIFIKKSSDTHSIEYRETCNSLVTKSEKIFNEIKFLDKNLIRKNFYNVETTVIHSNKLSTMFDYYTTNNELIQSRTKKRYIYSKRMFIKYDSNLHLKHITLDFIKKFEKIQLKSGKSQSTVDAALRDLRCVINYFTNVVKTVPKEYEYPFGKAGYSIKNSYSQKIVLSKEEFQKVIDFNEFISEKEKWAHLIWMFAYRSNGVNFADLLRMRWDHIRGNKYLMFHRKKTEMTRRNNRKEIIVPLTDKLKDIIEQVGNKKSPFILGLLPVDYTDTYFDNKCHKVRQEINKCLTILSKRLKLSVPLKLKTARETYATNLKRAGVPTSQIGEMLGHSNSIVTEHYLASLDLEKTFEINELIQ